MFSLLKEMFTAAQKHLFSAGDLVFYCNELETLSVSVSILIGKSLSVNMLFEEIARNG